MNAEADILATPETAHTMETASDEKRKVEDNSATNRAVEENQDLKRQLVFLQQQLVEKDRRIKKLESLVAGGGNNSPVSLIKQRKNSASQVIDPNHLSLFSLPICLTNF